MYIETKSQLCKLLQLAFVVALLPSYIAVAGSDCDCTVEWLDEDTVTGGDWYFNPVGSPIGVYGSYAHILPNAPQNRLQVPIGDFSIPIGSYSDPPYSWTGSQIAGLTYYCADPSYWDEYVSQEPAVTYSVSGTLYKPESASRAIQNLEGDTIYARPACWFAGSSNYAKPITLTMDLAAGSYLLSLYIMDYDSGLRLQEITVRLSETVHATRNVDHSFYNGLYQNFFVHLETAATVELIITHTQGANAVVSGVFLTSTSITPSNPFQDEVYWVSEDLTTQGAWMGTYGDIGFIKCAWNLPETGRGPAYLGWDPAYDHAEGIAYTVDTALYPWADKSNVITEIQYPVFEWAWQGWHETQTEHREVYYTTFIDPAVGGGPGWRLACWDGGGERSQPEHGYMDFILTFPEGTYLLSLYAYDYERTSRQSHEYRIYECGDMTAPVVTKRISGEAFDNGVYEIFTVAASAEGCTIVVRVYNDNGHPSTVNTLLSGIFIDKLEDKATGPKGLTIGFWKNNLAKNLGYRKGKAQVSTSDINNYLSAISDIYGDVCGDDTDSFLAYLDMEGAYAIISVADASDMVQKAQAQILAFLLTAHYYGLDYLDASVYLPDVGQESAYGGRMFGAIEYILGLYCDGQYKAAKNLADALNNMPEEGSIWVELLED